jgi:serine/threonine-protein kinase
VGGGTGGRKPGLRGVLTGVAALVVAALLALAAGSPFDDGSPQATSQAVATTSAVPTATADPATPSAALSATPSASASPSPTGSASPDSSAAPSDSPSPDLPDEETTGPGSPSDVPSSPPASPPASPPSTEPSSPPPTRNPVRVKSVSVSSLRQTSTTQGAATVDIATNGTGPVTIVVAWFTGNAKGELGAQDGSQTFERSGATQYTIALNPTFQGKGCYWGVRATTNPTAANGSSSQQILTRRCTIQ